VMVQVTVQRAVRLTVRIQFTTAKTTFLSKRYHPSNPRSPRDVQQGLRRRLSPNDPPKDWTMAEETAVCQAWCDVSENNIKGNGMKTKGFWNAVITYFEKETGSSRANHESGTNDFDVYHKACAKYKIMYKSDFTLEHCYNILKDHPASGGLNLNEEADEAVEETQEFRPIGRDRAKAKKKAAAGSSRGGSSLLVDLTLIPIRERLLVRGGFVTPDLLLPRRPIRNWAFSVEGVICLVGPGAHYNDIAQAQGPGWVSFSKHPGNTATCYTKPLDSLKKLNDRFFWVDAFACPASFSWNASPTVSNDPFPKSSQYNAEHYATLVAYPAPFHKYPEPFLCLVGISRYYTLDENTYPQFLRDNNEGGNDLLAFIRTRRSTKVRIGERQRGEDKPKLLDTTIGRTVPLLLVVPACAQSELDASVDRLFDEEGSGNKEEHHDSADGSQGTGTLIVSEAAEVVSEDVVPLRSRQRKRKTIVDAGEPSHPAKKLRDDHGAPGGPSVLGKSRSARKDEHPADSVPGLNLRTICAPQRFVISSDSSYHSGANIAKAEVDYVVRSSAPIIATVVTATANVATTTKEAPAKEAPAKEAPAKEAPAKPYLFVASLSSAGGTDPVLGGFSNVSGSDFLVGGIRTVVDLEFDLQKVYVPQWSVTNRSCLDDGRVCREMLDEFAPPKFFASIRGMEHDQLFTEFNVGATRQISLSAEVRMCAEYNIKEKRRLKAIVEEKDILLKTKGEEIDSLNAQLLLKEAEVAEAIHLRVKASRFGIVEKSLRDEVADIATTVKVREQEAADSDALVTTVKLQNDSLADQVRELEASSAGLQEKVTAYEKFVDQLEKFQYDKIKEVNDKLEKLDADVVAMVLHLEEKFYPHLLNTIIGRRWLLTHGMELAVTKCLNSKEYLSALGAAIGKAVEKGMQEGLSAGITHGIEGRTLTDIAANNPSAEADYLAALHHL
ncbi:hypothetical protein Tco_1131001, partial [Tanacetum coccineum]